VLSFNQLLRRQYVPSYVSVLIELACQEVAADVDGAVVP
jgi:hypothetical protein